MLNFSYTLTAQIKSELEKIEYARREILLSVISPRDELRLQWETTLSRIQASLLIRDIAIDRRAISALLSAQGKKRLSDEEKEVISYRQAYDYIRQEWTGSSLSVTVAEIEHLHSLFTKEKLGVSESNISEMLDFIQVNPEHPVIQAALSSVLFLHISSYDDKFIRISQLLPLIFLYKHGYDLRSLLSTEEYIQTDTIHYLDLVRKSRQEGNLSSFLDYYSLAVSVQAEKAATKLSERQFDIRYPDSFFELTERQKQILAHLQAPGSKISNRQVQTLFKVSQITSSRDLAKLSSLGLIFPIGKGRSVQYTRS